MPGPIEDAPLDATLFRALGERVRVDLLLHLAAVGPADVGQIAAHFPQDRSVISRHLRQLEQAGALRRERHSRRVIYTVDRDILVGRLEQILQRLRGALGDGGVDAPPPTPAPPPATAGPSPGSPRRSRPGSFRPGRRRSS